ncbi:MAG: cation-transporting P-type ATPase [Anaerolineae bacterium]|nr:cation-transporting P-type ATPase [Anaerolineae bacterium]
MNQDRVDEPQQGETVLLQAGDLVAADLRLLEARGLEVDEFDVTGEIVPVAKVLGEEPTILYRGSRITRGSGKGVVIANREAAEYEEYLRQPWEPQAGTRPSPIEGSRFWWLALLLPPLLVAFHHYGARPLLFLLAAATVVLVLVLPNGALFQYVATRMAAAKLRDRGIRVRGERALERLGALDTVCLDKTGVLTSREMVVRQVHFAEGPADMAAFGNGGERATLTEMACALGNDVFFLERLGRADPIDRALVAFAESRGFDIGELTRKHPRIYDLPFDSEARYMAAGFDFHDHALYFAKGDPEVILPMCGDYLNAVGAETKLDPAALSRLRHHLEAAGQAGDILIALAYHRGARGAPPQRYTFLAAVQLANPLRPGVPAMVAGLKEAGLRVVMLTGDRLETAMAIAREAGIYAGPAASRTGKQVAAMALTELARRTASASVFARLLPWQKGLLIRVWRQTDQVVAMVGDGANDTIALRVADVGISLVEGSSPLAKRESQVLIREVGDLLPLIQGARSLHQLIRRFVVVRMTALMAVLLPWYAWISVVALPL